MFHIILYNPQIPPNTGNIVRLCANTGSKLHLIRPLGFDLDVKSFRRAGLDYHCFSQVFEYENIDDCLNDLKPENYYAITKFGKINYSEVEYNENDVLIFGSETNGLPDEFLNKISYKSKLFIPMIKKSRSLNLSNAVSIVVYEAWKKVKFKGSVSQKYIK